MGKKASSLIFPTYQVMILMMYPLIYLVIQKANGHQINLMFWNIHNISLTYDQRVISQIEEIKKHKEEAIIVQ
uniref:Putative secreted protein n=1 Tax=Xenopsylla cheopis TaxID=163159 RepID=A0A6M2DYZ6_XENCH